MKLNRKECECRKNEIQKKKGKFKELLFILFRLVDFLI